MAHDIGVDFLIVELDAAVVIDLVWNLISVNLALMPNVRNSERLTGDFKLNTHLRNATKQLTFWLGWRRNTLLKAEKLFFFMEPPDDLLSMLRKKA